MPDKVKIIKLLKELADMMEFKGENQFKVNAYRNGAFAIRSLETDIDELINEKKLDTIKGIGKGLQSVIYEFAENGSSTLYDELKKDVPDGIEDLFLIKGLGPKKVMSLLSELGISDLTMLESAVKEKKLTGLKGFTDTLINSIPDEIHKIRENKKFVLLNKAFDTAAEIIDRTGAFNSVEKIEMTGELRRGREIISLLPFIAMVKKGKDFIAEAGTEFNITNDEGFVTINDFGTIPIRIYYYDNTEDYQKGLVVTTGSTEFIDKSFGGSPLKGKNEKEIFKNAGVPFLIPEMREEQYFSVKNKKLKENSDLSLDEFKGMLHWHTTYSDGRDTLETMLDEVEKMHFSFAAICDHSKSAAYANGLKEARILAQKEDINKLQAKYKVKLFQGIECDILADGSLDYSDDFLPNLDFVVASVHSRFNLDEKEMTARIIKAVENPYTDLLGHPSGRLLLSRDPYKINTQKIIDACAGNSVAIEINSHPKRLDLDWRWIYYAREKGCLFSINADAHSKEDFYKLKYGIMMGRKGGLKNEEVINCFDIKTFSKFLNRKVKRNING
jgi:DNA polymerase (family 10)